MSKRVNGSGRDRWAEALTWYTTLREADVRDVISGTRREWQDWYSDARNKRIFDDASRLLAGHTLYRKRPKCEESELESDRYDPSLSIAEWHRTEALAARSPRRFVQNLASGWIAAAAFVALLFVWPWFGSGGRTVSSVIYHTDVGRIEHIHLPDGSSITLGGRTRLSVAFSAKERSVTLIDGQAWFNVTHHAHWPFEVMAGAGMITDLGTAFLVTRESDRVVVTVTQGEVDVSTREPISDSAALPLRFTRRPALAPIHLARGEELAFGDNGLLSPVKSTDIRTAIAWTHGRLIFDDQSLRSVVETIDRYSSRRIVVSHSAGALRFSGIVSSEEIGPWLQSLDQIFPISVDESGAGICIHLRAQADQCGGT